MTTNDPFVAIIKGIKPGTIIHKDDDKSFALINYAINTTKAQAEEHPILQQGFTIKFHCGAFETIEHPKLHVLSTE